MFLSNNLLLYISTGALQTFIFFLLVTIRPGFVPAPPQRPAFDKLNGSLLSWQTENKEAIPDPERMHNWMALLEEADSTAWKDEHYFI